MDPQFFYDKAVPIDVISSSEIMSLGYIGLSPNWILCIYFKIEGIKKNIHFYREVVRHI